MLITNFASGELSKTLYGRADLPQYYQGASRLKNFNIIPTGGIERRNGFKRCDDMEGKSRLIPFSITANVSYILEFGPGYLQLWKDGVKLENWRFHNTSHDEETEVTVDWLPTTYTQARELQYAQNFNEMYFVHRDLPPFMLKWKDTSDITLSKMLFDIEPDIIWHSVDKEKYPYDPQKDPDLPEADSTTFRTVGNYPGVIAFYQNRLWLGSTAKNPNKIWASSVPYADEETEGHKVFSFEWYNHYVTISRVIKNPELQVFTCNGEKGANKLTNVSRDLSFITFSDDNPLYASGNGIPEGTKVTAISANQITLDKNLTEAISNITCTVQRWVSASTTTDADYTLQYDTDDMTTADNGFYFEIASEQNETIKWISPSQHLVIGTESSEYVIPSGSNALSFAVSLNGRHSSADIQALYVGEAVIFFAQGKKAVREYYWNNDQAAFTSNNIAILNPDIIAESESVDFDYMNNPYSRLLITKQDGTIAVLLYEKSSGVLGWSRYEHSKGQIISVATVKSDTESDTIYAAVQYGNNYVMEELNLTGNVYLDSWKQYTEANEALYTTDAVIYNATENKIYSLSDTNKPPYGMENVYIGYEYESLITSMPVVNNNITGQKRITDLSIRFSESCLPEIVNTAGTTEQITGIEEPFSGIRKVNFPGSSYTDVFFTIRTSKPKKCTVLAVNANLA